MVLNADISEVMILGEMCVLILIYSYAGLCRFCVVFVFIYFPKFHIQECIQWM